MKYLSEWKWDDVVFNSATRLGWQSYNIDIQVHEGQAMGGGIDGHSLMRDFNCLGLSDLVDEGMFKVSMREVAKGFETIFVFEETGSSDYSTLCEWPDEMPLGRFVSAGLDGSHGRNSYFAAMFRGDDASSDQAMLFKLKYC